MRLQDRTAIYGLFYKATPTEIFYTGKSIDPERRLHGHRLDHKRTDIEMIVFDVVPNRNWKDAEIFAIAACRQLGHPIINKASGGQGCTGFRMTAEQREKCSRGRVGIKFTAEHRANIGAAGKGRTATPETRAKLSKAHKGVPNPGVSRANKGRKITWDCNSQQAAETRKANGVVPWNTGKSGYSLPAWNEQRRAKFTQTVATRRARKEQQHRLEADPNIGRSVSQTSDQTPT